ncbi:HlyC/CorC family transporter [Nitriliruptoraceae bacterium ZYF776]|nr:HlyC/CorC family transporter [Profundirhabdus halotolerans]
MTTQLLLVGGLVLLNAVFAGSEIALISLRETQLARLERTTAAGPVLARLAREPNRFLSTIQIGITLAGFLASATAAVTLSEPLVEPLAFLGRAARPTSILLVTAGLSFVTLVAGELAPKRLAMQRAERWALLVARPLSLLAVAASPVIWVLSRTTDLLVRLLGGDPNRDREDVTHEEVHDLVTGTGLYEGFERQVISGALEVVGRTLRQVVTPRTDVLALPAALSVDDALRELAAAGHSRAPVYRHHLDDADRFVSVLGLLGRDGTVDDHAAATLVVPETLGVLDTLRRLQTERRQLALVINEHGGLEGIVTVEDLVEELVGEIYDEHDRDVVGVVTRDDGTRELPGRFPVHDLVDLEVDLRGDEQATTVGGLFGEILGRLPVVGDRIDLGTHRLEVIEVEGRTVTLIRMWERGETDVGSDGDGATSDD